MFLKIEAACVAMRTAESFLLALQVTVAVQSTEKNNLSLGQIDSSS